MTGQWRTGLRRLEDELEKDWPAANWLTCYSDPVSGLLRSNRIESPVEDDRTAGTDAGRLPWLFKVEEAPPPLGDGTLSFFHACGTTNEVREILRNLLGVSNYAGKPELSPWQLLNRWKGSQFTLNKK